jgi:hypothetical protein
LNNDEDDVATLDFFEKCPHLWTTRNKANCLARKEHKEKGAKNQNFTKFVGYFYIKHAFCHYLKAASAAASKACVFFLLLLWLLSRTTSPLCKASFLCLRLRKGFVLSSSFPRVAAFSSSPFLLIIIRRRRCRFLL